MPVGDRSLGLTQSLAQNGHARMQKTVNAAVAKR